MNIIIIQSVMVKFNPHHSPSNRLTLQLCKGGKLELTPLGSSLPFINVKYEHSIINLHMNGLPPTEGLLIITAIALPPAVYVMLRASLCVNVECPVGWMDGMQGRDHQHPERRHHM